MQSFDTPSVRLSSSPDVAARAEEKEEAMSTSLEGRVAVVTGGARGLGRGIADHLAKAGARVVVADVIDGSECVAALQGTGHGYRGLDVTDTAAVERQMNAVKADFGSLDILVNNAGISQPIGSVLDTTDEVIDRVFAVNVRGLIACSRAAARLMLEQGRGKIINISSQTGRRAWRDWGVYSASKFAVVGITQVMAQELAPTVAVNAICPGTMWSDMTRGGFTASLASDDTLDAALARKASTIPFGRLGTADDVGAMAAWIASDACSFTTGSTFNLTGGEEVFF
jgi:NAD(P)-dependent dehydrogenase (short-subunit alcohol dehydrogenase family)